MPTYPDNWDEIRTATYQRAGYKCEHCGEQFTHTRKAVHDRNKNGDPIILTVHHLDGDTTNNDWTNLLSACQRCHLHIQARWKPGWSLPWPEPPKWLTDRKLPYLIQMEMF